MLTSGTTHPGSLSLSALSRLSLSLALSLSALSAYHALRASAHSRGDSTSPSRPGTRPSAQPPRDCTPPCKKSVEPRTQASWPASSKPRMKPPGATDDTNDSHTSASVTPSAASARLEDRGRRPSRASLSELSAALRIADACSASEPRRSAISARLGEYANRRVYGGTHPNTPPPERRLGGKNTSFDSRLRPPALKLAVGAHRLLEHPAEPVGQRVVARGELRDRERRGEARAAQLLRLDKKHAALKRRSARRRARRAAAAPQSREERRRERRAWTRGPSTGPGWWTAARAPAAPPTAPTSSSFC